MFCSTLSLITIQIATNCSAGVAAAATTATMTMTTTTTKRDRVRTTANTRGEWETDASVASDVLRCSQPDRAPDPNEMLHRTANQVRLGLLRTATVYLSSC